MDGQISIQRDAPRRTCMHPYAIGGVWGTARGSGDPDARLAGANGAPGCRAGMKLLQSITLVSEDLLPPIPPFLLSSTAGARAITAINSMDVPVCIFDRSRSEAGPLDSPSDIVPLTGLGSAGESGDAHSNMEVPCSFQIQIQTRQGHIPSHFGPNGGQSQRWTINTTRFRVAPSKLKPSVNPGFSGCSQTLWSVAWNQYPSIHGTTTAGLPALRGDPSPVAVPQWCSCPVSIVCLR